MEHTPQQLGILPLATNTGNYYFLKKFSIGGFEQNTIICHHVIPEKHPSGAIQKSLE